MKTSLARFSVLAGIALSSPALAQKSEAEFALNQSIKREGEGAARLAANASELLPPKAKWADLTDWSGGEAITPELAQGRPVLVLTWTAWAPASQKLVRRVAKLAEANKDLLVVAVHSKDNFDAATKWVTENNVKIRIAREADGSFIKALASDQAPDIYLIDRAGNLRYADIESESLDAAVAELVAETKEVAASKPAERTAQYKQWLEDRDRSQTTGNQIRPGQAIKVPFEKPDAGQYEKALWIEKNKAEFIQGANDMQLQALPFNFEHVHWFTEKPDTNGKIVIVDFWATWASSSKLTAHLLDEMQRTFRSDLQIIGITGLTESRATVQRWMNANKTEPAHCYDNQEKIIKAINLNTIPMVAILSTDGIVRWQGNPLTPGFRQIVESTINQDPGVAARRKAEREFIRKSDEAAKGNAAKGN